MSTREDFLVSKIDRSREGEQGRENRLRFRSLLDETARSVVNALFGHRSEEERTELAWLVIDQILDRVAGWVGPEKVVSRLGQSAGRIGFQINPKASAKTAADRLLSAKEPA